MIETVLIYVHEFHLNLRHNTWKPSITISVQAKKNPLIHIVNSTKASLTIINKLSVRNMEKKELIAFKYTIVCCLLVIQKAWHIAAVSSKIYSINC